MSGSIIGTGVTGLIGVLFVFLGLLIWKRKKINLFHNYHIDKVSPESRKGFCTLSGIGFLVMGISLLITAVILGVTDSAFSFFIFAVGFIAGFIMLVAAGRKYNS